jgi:hypothetical protein
VAIQFSGCDYSLVKPIQDPIGVAKLRKYPCNTHAQFVHGAFLAIPTSVLAYRWGSAQAASGARFCPARKWVAKFRDYWRLRAVSNVITSPAHRARPGRLEK